MPATTAPVPGQAGSRRNAPATRRSILAAARDLFASQGYAGTSIADIAGRLGTSKAALYYHFQSKAEILQALLDEPVTAWARLADSATTGQRSAEDLLSAVIDTTAGLHTRGRGDRQRPVRASTARAHAAYAQPRTAPWPCCQRPTAA